MKKLSVYSKTILAVVAVGAASLAGYLISDYYNTLDKIAYSVKYGSISMFSFDADATDTVSVTTRKNETFNMKYDSGSWSMTDSDILPNEAGIELTVSVMSALSSTRTISLDATEEELRLYGFDTPVTITCSLTDGSSHTVYIGDLTPSGEYYYAMRDGENYIYLISIDVGGYLDCSKDDLKDPYLINYGTIYSDVKYIELERDGEKVFEFEYGNKWEQEPVQSKLSTTDGDRWTALYPIDWPANYSDITRVIDNVVRITVADFVEEDGANLARYGLDTPSARFVVRTVKDGDIPIIFGNKNIDGKYIYAMYEDTGQICMFNTADVSFLELEATELYNQVVYNAHSLVTNDNQTDIAEINAVVDGKKYHITNNSYDDVNEYSLNGIDITTDANASGLLEQFYISLAELLFTSVDANAIPSTAQQPYLSYEYITADGQTISVALYPTPEDSLRYYIFLDGQYTKTVVRESVIDGATGIRVSCNALANHMKRNYPQWTELT